MISACKTLKGCRVEMLNSGLLGWMPKSNLVKVFFFGLFPGCVVKSDVLDENGSKKCCLVFLKILDLENDPS